MGEALVVQIGTGRLKDRWGKVDEFHPVAADLACRPALFVGRDRDDCAVIRGVVWRELRLTALLAEMPSMVPDHIEDQVVSTGLATELLEGFDGTAGSLKAKSKTNLNKEGFSGRAFGT